LSTASSRLAQHSEIIGERSPEEKLEREKQKVQEDREKLFRKHNEKLKKLQAEGQDSDIEKEQRKYEEDLKKLERRLGE
jgi:Skp family chaperone for outer membrane proteins